MATTDPALALAGLWRTAGLDPAALDRLRLAGREPALPSTYAIGTAAQASIAASALAAAELHRRRGGAAQQVAVSMRHAAIEFRSERHIRTEGSDSGARWDPIAGPYRCGDGRWVRLHTNFPHHRDGVLRLLGCANTREAVAAALSRRKALDFEADAAAAGLCVTATRSTAEWLGSPQGRAAAALPPVLIERIGDAPPRPLPPAADRPLAGFRALDLTRVIAGPVCGRVLAAHGAEVLHLTGPDLPNFPDLIPDTGRGKRPAHLDLGTEAGRDRLLALARGADLFVQGYRPGALAARGFSPAALAAEAPGLVCVGLSAYGHLGPWSGRRGFDSLVQNANGMNLEEAAAAGTEGPKPLPCQALDHASGYLLALGAMAALIRRAEEGGSWLVRVSLAGTGEWIRGLGRLPDGLSAPEPEAAEVEALLEESDSGFGRMRAVRHAGLLAATPARWDRPALPLGSVAPAWLDG
ncbi:CoA transferase [Roseomonas sp. NAR14]|uniref:CoA transferase n=1 Tax=Roseomonas acroporae TaxID=2937791 RepID=A0A9X1Y990_9PROT|nr:CoA transferase [Roseomonas acroporae]MCK8784472.1 CoA transferase [Roseomonas acroporae]